VYVPFVRQIPAEHLRQLCSGYPSFLQHSPVLLWPTLQVSESTAPISFRNGEKAHSTWVVDIAAPQF
jgi:hypothetical protein